ncbi:hypothetical protein V8C44DRAFT_320802 [Trichoderma aethiopicum]
MPYLKSRRKHTLMLSRCAHVLCTTASSSWFSQMLIGGISVVFFPPLKFRASTAYSSSLFAALVRSFLRARTTRKIARGISLQRCQSASQLNRCKHVKTTQSGAGNKVSWGWERSDRQLVH